MLAQRPVGALAFAAILSLGSLACDDPCLALAHDLCMCEPTELEQRACVQRIDAVSVDDPTQGEEDCCIRLQETCTCEQLAAGNLAACGIAQEEEGTVERACLVSDSLEPDPG